MLFEYHAAEAYMYAKYTDRSMNLAQVLQWVDCFVDHDDFRKASNVVWDATAVETVNLNFTDMQTFGAHVGELRDRRGAGRSAFVSDKSMAPIALIRICPICSAARQRSTAGS